MKQVQAHAQCICRQGWWKSLYLVTLTAQAKKGWGMAKLTAEAKKGSGMLKLTAQAKKSWCMFCVRVYSRHCTL